MGKCVTQWATTPYLLQEAYLISDETIINAKYSRVKGNLLTEFQNTSRF